MTKKALKILFLILLAYIFTIKGLIGNLSPSATGENRIRVNKPPFETSMERGRYAQVVSLAESHNFDVNEFYKFLKPDLAWYNGNFFSTFPVGAAVLAVPFYILGKLVGLAQVFTFATSAFFSLSTAYIVYLICLQLKQKSKTAAFAAIVYSLASVAWAYSVSFSAHPISAFVLALGVLLFLKAESNQNNLMIFFTLGLLFASGLFIDYPNMVIFLPIILFVFLGKIITVVRSSELFDVHVSNFKAIVSNLLGFGLIFALFVGFNLFYFHKPIAFTNAYTIKFLETSGIDFEKITLTNDIFNQHNYSNRFSMGGSFKGIQTLLVSHDRGLFYYSPIYLLSIVGAIILFKKNKRITLVAISIFLVNLIIYASYDDPWGGWAFGPRYLIASLPVLAVLAGEGYEYVSNRFGKKAVVVVMLVLAFSIGVALLGALTTNAVPPSIEAKGTGLSDNFMNNWYYIHHQGTSSFIHSLGILKNIPAFTYGLALWILISLSAILLVI